MEQYGVYRTRIPYEKIENPTEKSMLFIKNAKLSKGIYDKHNIIYPDNFMGCEEINQLNAQNIS